jgi:hypothetical protein
MESATGFHECHIVTQGTSVECDCNHIQLTMWESLRRSFVNSRQEFAPEIHHSRDTTIAPLVSP